MKIVNSDIMMKSDHAFSQSLEKSESMNFWVTEDNNSNITIVDIVDISEESQIAYKENFCVQKAQDDDILFEISEQDKNKLKLIASFMEHLTGKKMAFKFFEKISFKKEKSGNKKSPQAAAPDDGRVGWGFEYNRHERYEESEKLSFTAKGIIKTQDGQQIKIDLELNMSRQFIEENNLQIKAGDALIDPLVINFDDAAPSLTQEKYIFDIDSDGLGDQVSFVSPGSGLLALDLNNDGVINNGKELFGPSTQDGFGELGEYDLDGNGWIDENDPIFDKLRIWVKDENGNDQLFAIGQKGVGAIYLGNIDTQFDIKDTDNTMLGQLRSSSIYISKDGDVGTIHQIDLAK